jgi:hypothetical protein
MNPDSQNNDQPIVDIDRKLEEARSLAREKNMAQIEDEEARREKESLKKEIDSKNRALDRVDNYQEILAGEPESAEDLITALELASFEDLRNARREQKYGKGVIGTVKAFLAGESDITKVEDGEIKEVNKAAIIGRKALMTLLNKKNIAGAGAVIGLGALTGGIGWASYGVILGSTFGRAAAEGLSHKKELDARKDVFIAEKKQWLELSKKAKEYGDTDDIKKKTKLANEIVEMYYERGEEEVVENLRSAKTKLGETRVSQDKLRSRLQIVGGIIGGGAGVAGEVLSGRVGGAIDLDLWNRIEGQDIAHEVVKKDDQWHFLYTEAEKAAGMGGGVDSHILGDPIWLSSNQADIAVATAVQKSAPVLAAAWGGSALVNGIENYFAKRKALKKINRNEEVINRISPEKISAEGNFTSNPSSEKEEEEEKDLSSIFKENNKPYPKVGQYWIRELTKKEDEDSDDNSTVFRIDKINNGKAEVTYFDLGALISPDVKKYEDIKIESDEINLDEVGESNEYSIVDPEATEQIEKYRNIFESIVVIPIAKDKQSRTDDFDRFGELEPGTPVKVKEIINENEIMVDILNPFKLIEEGEEEIIKSNQIVEKSRILSGTPIIDFWPGLKEEDEDEGE